MRVCLDEYELELLVGSNEFSVLIKQIDNPQFVWNGNFTRNQIQQFTTKARYPLEFEKFTDLLEQTLKGYYGDCFVDVFTYEKLKNLMGQNSGGNNTTTISRNENRYLILTIPKENRPIHFPLPLQPIDKSRNKTKRTTKSVDVQEKSVMKLKEKHPVLSSKASKEIGYEQEEQEIRHLKKKLDNQGKRLKQVEAEAEFLAKEANSLKKKNEKCEKHIQMLKRDRDSLAHKLKDAKSEIKNLNEKIMHYRRQIKERVRATETKRTSNTQQKPRYSQNVSYSGSNNVRRRPLSADVSMNRRKTTDRELKTVNTSFDNNSSRHRRPSSARSSISNSSVPVFDPTSWVKERQRKIEENKKKRKGGRGLYSPRSTKDSNRESSSIKKNYKNDVSSSHSSKPSIHPQKVTSRPLSSKSDVSYSRRSNRSVLSSDSDSDESFDDIKQFSRVSRDSKTNGLQENSYRSSKDFIEDYKESAAEVKRILKGFENLKKLFD
eukprot:TRINITY_DN3334_c0_g1_i1.p1 TRINITY_DN3334_c0_g1~~TRINITY_DN3334_c0_g1_i1.p1  ORF type:complete len:504 (+),score=116.47 TRINITY_DN3334_c0_g1_i1:42-1514(+)